MNIEIDTHSGFCFGVTTAISKAEEELANSHSLYCLGDIVHNGRECERLHKLGLETVDHAALNHLHGTKVLLRAHGEPPQTYLTAKANQIDIIDATCPVVLNLQKRIKAEYDADTQHERQIVIYGKNGHAEVVGLVGQTCGTAVVIENLEDAKHLDFTRPVSLYSQTTKSLEGFREIVQYIGRQLDDKGLDFRYFDTICRQVANRMPNIREFAQRHDVVIFVCGRKSSNGKVLYNECSRVNPCTHLVENPSEIQLEWLQTADGPTASHFVRSVGICGATSTPKWLMEQCREAIEQMKANCE